MCVCVFSSFAGVFTSACMLVCSFADMFGDWFPFVRLFLCCVRFFVIWYGFFSICSGTCMYFLYVCLNVLFVCLGFVCS